MYIQLAMLGLSEQDTDIVFSTYVFRLKKLNKQN